MIFLYFAVLILSFAIMFKCAEWFVEGASGIARVLNVSKMIVGIVLVGMATTAPEFFVSVLAAYLKHPEIALGNAVGSVICDDGIALALAALLAPTVIMVNCRMLKVVGLFLLCIDFMAYLLARNGTVGRVEGFIFVVILVVYYLFIVRGHKTIFYSARSKTDEGNKNDVPSFSLKKAQLKKPLLFFLGGITGVVISSRLIVWVAINIARYFKVSEIIIALTVVAIGTSLPEISTCITAALKGEGEIAVGNIIGADILNILWIIGVASIVNPITVEREVINFAFPYMILIVAVMLAAMRIGCRLGRIKGLILFALYLIYLFFTLKLFI
jgi:cation:H+ antiporter